MGGHLGWELLTTVRCRQSRQRSIGYHQRGWRDGGMEGGRASCESHRSTAFSLVLPTDDRGGRPLGEIPHRRRIQRPGIDCPLKSLLKLNRKASPVFLPFFTDAVKPEVFASPSALETRYSTGGSGRRLESAGQKFRKLPSSSATAGRRRSSGITMVGPRRRTVAACRSTASAGTGAAA